MLLLLALVSSIVDDGTSLVHAVDLVWLALVAAVVASPFIQLLAKAGTYGKLKQEVTDQSTQVPSDERSVQTVAPAGGSVTSGILLHPALYIRTSTAFKAYYMLACAWNGALLVECTLVFLSGSFARTPTLHLLRFVASWFHSSMRLQVDTVDLSSDPARTAVLLLLLQMAMLQLHLMRRVYESLYVTKFSSRSSQHGVVTIMGMFYYFLCVVTPVIDSPLVDGTVSQAFLLLPALRTPCVAVGILLFAFGWYHQHVAHRILADLRVGTRTPSSGVTGVGSSASGADRYSIPFGSLFAYVSMPHYLCEMIEYTALWIVAGMKLSQWLVCLWVYSNLGITAIRSHRWYRQQFPKYPRNRRALIPGLL